MNKIKNKKINFPGIVLLAAIISVWPAFGFLNKEASAESTCNTLSDEAERTKCIEKQIKANETKRKTYQELVYLKKKTAITITNQLSLIDTQQQKNQAELSKTQAETKSLAQQIDDLDREIANKEKSLQYQQAILSGLIQMYYEYNQDGILNIALADQDFSEIFSQSDHIEQSSGRVNDVLKNIRETKNELQSEYDTITQKKQESEQLKEKLENKNLDLQKNENQKQALLGQTQAEIAKYKELLANIEDEISSLEQNLSGTVNMANLPPDKSGYFTYPVNPHNITQGFGKTSFAKSSGMYKNNFHNGFDFGIKYSNVFAAKDGKVVGSGDNGKYAYGKWIAVNHGDGLTTLYGHLSEKSVSKGDTVKEGQKIGISGNTGNSTGPHLHFSVFASETFKTVESSYVGGLMIPTGAPVNPKKYL